MPRDGNFPLAQNPDIVAASMAGASPAEFSQPIFKLAPFHKGILHRYV
jgi:hypothetical protein